MKISLTIIEVKLGSRRELITLSLIRAGNLRANWLSNNCEHISRHVRFK